MRARDADTMNDDLIPQPRPVLTDEAAATILDFLHDLVADFESAYYVQLRRHESAHDQDRDPDRPWLRKGENPGSET